MRAIELDGDLVHAGGGTLQGDLYDALAAHGRAFAGGCGPDVGLAGLLLGGGLGILGRTYGFTADQLVAAEVVLADGRVVECDEHARAGPVLGAAGRGRRAVRGGHALHAAHGSRAGHDRLPRALSVVDRHHVAGVGTARDGRRVAAVRLRVPRVRRRDRRGGAARTARSRRTARRWTCVRPSSGWPTTIRARTGSTIIAPGSSPSRSSSTILAPAASTTSTRSAAPTTAWPPTPPRSRTATRASA